MEITKDRFFELVNDEDDGFEYVEENITGGKHSDQFVTLVVKEKATGKIFGIDYSRSYEWGVHDDQDFELYPMKAVQTTTYVQDLND